MAQIKADRVKEATATTGTGNLTLDGAVAGYRAFSSVMANGDTCYYAIASVNGTDWETGYGTLNSPTQFNRSFVKASSNSNTLVDFASGPKEIALTLTASELSQTLEVPHGVSNGRYSFDTNGVLYSNITTSGGTYNNFVVLGSGAASLTCTTPQDGRYYSGSVIIGWRACTNAPSVYYSVAIGSEANSSGKISRSCAIGWYALSRGDGSQPSNTFNNHVVSIGYYSGAVSTGSYNVFLGSYSGLSVVGINNVALGDYSLGGANSEATQYNSNNSHLYCTAVGTQTLRWVTNASRVTAVGNRIAYGSFYTFSNSVFLGSYITPTADGLTNTIIIGDGATDHGSNTTTIGNSSTTDTYLFGNVIPTGGFQPASISDSSAPSNAIYFSTTAGKLVYKDASGTVNNLY